MPALRFFSSDDFYLSSLFLYKTFFARKDEERDSIPTLLSRLPLTASQARRTEPSRESCSSFSRLCYRSFPFSTFRCRAVVFDAVNVEKLKAEASEETPDPRKTFLREDRRRRRHRCRRCRRRVGKGLPTATRLVAR